MTTSTVDPLTSALASTVSTPSTSASTSTPTTGTSTANSSSSVDPSSFLQMFVAEMQNQDPLEPMSNSDMMSQITQLNQIQNTQDMKSILQSLSATITGQNPIGNYLDLIGKQVKVQASDGTTQDGQVLSVGKDSSNNIVFEMQNGDSYNVSNIVGVSDV